MTLVNCTVANNHVSWGSYGGGLYAGAGLGGGPVIRNTVVGGNSGPPNDQGPDIFGSVQSQDYNMVQRTGGHTMSGPTAHSILGGDPRLGPLASNGGETQTHALQSGSPAIDAGSCTDVDGGEIEGDQRGVARPQGVTCDMGAFEVGQPSLVLAATPETQATGSPVQLTATALDELGQPMPGRLVLFEVAPLGAFPGGATSVTVPTDGAGQATTTLTSDTAGETTVTAVSDAGGGDSVSITFSEAVHITGLESDSPVTLGQTVHFTATVTGSEPITYTWDFGGAGTGSGEGTATPTYVYAHAGTYTVTLAVENACGSAEAELLVEVYAPPVIADLTSDGPVTLGQAVHFTATVTGSEPITYTWDFGGAGTGSGEGTANPTWTYDDAGTYTVTLAVENACGTAEAELLVEVCTPPVIADLASDGPVTLGQTVHFTATVTGSEPITYTWDFGGAGTGSGEGTPTPTYVYAHAGTYTVTLAVENACGSAEAELLVEVCAPPEILHLTSDDPVKVGETVHFTATVTGSEPITYTWDFGGAGTGSDLETANPTWTYDDAGTYTVTLAVENACGTDQAELLVEVCAPPVITDLTSDGPVTLGQAVHFTATVTGSEPITYTWDFGGAGTGSGEGTATPTYVYAHAGAYTVTLAVENACGTDQAELLVEVCAPPVIAELTSDGPVVLGETVHFTATVTGSEPMTYTWDFRGAGTGSGEGTATPSYAYAQAGAYTVTLAVENACGTAEAELLVEVCAPPVIADLTSDGPVTLGQAVHFTATVTGSEPITYTWDFGGAGTGSGEGTATPIYTYAHAGAYTVTLQAENACGTDQAELLVEVCAPPVIADLTSDGPVTVGETVHFTATVTGSEPITYTWDFGGAGTGSDLATANPTWTYDDARDYTVTLTVTNPCGSHADTLPVRVEVHELYLPLVARGYTP